MRDKGGLSPPCSVRNQATTTISSRTQPRFGKSLSQNHPFIDRNKRTAFAATGIVLGRNGLALVAGQDDAIDCILGLYATGAYRFEKLEPWLRACTQQRPLGPANSRRGRTYSFDGSKRTRSSPREPIAIKAEPTMNNQTPSVM